MLATAKPITPPPKNATMKADRSPSSRAAIVVRTLARVAACIPMAPVSKESNEPTKKQAAERNDEKAASNTTANRSTIKIMRYSSKRNVIAPVRIASAICAALAWVT